MSFPVAATFEETFLTGTKEGPYYLRATGFNSLKWTNYPGGTLTLQQNVFLGS
jgi:hypothetical protein